jgi:hypothetical protein
MMGRPIREDLEGPGSQTQLTANQIKKMQQAMLELWQTSLEYAVTTWRTRGRLRSTPDKVNEWYKMGPITEDTMRGMFEHVYRARKEPPTGKRHIVDHGFTVETESAQRPRDQITEDSAVKRRKLTESTEVIKARKARKAQEKAEEKEEKRVASEKKKQAVEENAKKAKAAATAAKARERKKRRAKPPLAKRAREEGKQGVQDPEGPRTKQARTGAEKDSDQPNKHVHTRTTRNSNKAKEESQGVSIRNNTEVSNINKEGICAKGDG